MVERTLYEKRIASYISRVAQTPAKEALLYRVICALDDICSGTKGVRNTRHKYLSVFVAYYYSIQHGDSVLESKLQKVIDEILETESAYPLIKRHISIKFKNAQEIKNFFIKNQGYGGVLKFVLKLSNWDTKNDLLENCEKIGWLLDTGNVLKMASFWLENETVSTEEVTENIIGLHYLAKATADFYMASTLNQLPTVSTTMPKRDRDFVLQMVRRYSVDSQVLTLKKALVDDTLSILSDIEDFLVDYPKNSIRVAGKKKFRNCLLKLTE